MDVLEDEVLVARRVATYLVKKWKTKERSKSLLGAVWAGVHTARLRGVEEKHVGNEAICTMIDWLRSEKPIMGRTCRGKLIVHVGCIHDVVPGMRATTLEEVIPDSRLPQDLTEPVLAGWCRTRHLRRDLDLVGRIALYLQAVEDYSGDEAAAAVGLSRSACQRRTWQVRKVMKERIKQEGLY